MAGKRTRRPGQGFSLFDLQEDIASTVDSLGDALSRQGVAVDRDSLLLSIQNVVQSIGNAGSNVGGGNYGYPSLASDAEVPYSVAGDLLCMAHEYFQLGNKKEAVKTMLTAMESDDFNQISEGLLEMNRLSEKTNREIFANDPSDTNSEDDTDETEDSDDDEDGDDDTDSTDDDLSDDDIDDLIEDSNPANESTADDGDEDNSMEHTEKKDNDSKNSGIQDEEEGEDSDDKEGDKSVPMGGTSSTMEASMTSKIIANKLSLQGDSKSRSRAQDFIKKHNKL